MASFPPYSGSPSYYSAPGAGRLNTDPGANRQNTFSPGVGAPYTNPAWSAPIPLTNTSASSSNQSTNKPEEKRPTKVTFLKCGLEILVCTVAILAGTLGGGSKYLVNKFGTRAGTMIGGWIIPMMLSGLTGGIFSCVYQKMKNGAINAKTLLNDTLWGTIGC